MRFIRHYIEMDQRQAINMKKVLQNYNQPLFDDPHKHYPKGSVNLCSRRANDGLRINQYKKIIYGKDE